MTYIKPATSFDMEGPPHPDSPTPLLEDLMYRARLDTFPLSHGQLAMVLPAMLDSNLVDAEDLRPWLGFMQVALDDQLSLQMDAILHHPYFQQIEATWRALHFLVENIEPGRGVLVHFLHFPKEELREDLEYAADITCSEFFRHVYSADFGQFGGIPIAAVIGDYSFDRSAADLKLLQQTGQVCAMAHAPFLTAVAPQFFGMKTITGFDAVRVGDLHTLLDSPVYNKWHSLRESEEARYIGLTVPKFLMRVPYEDAKYMTRSFIYTEEARFHHHFVWGNSAYLLATRLAESFIHTGWCLNIVGAENGGAIKGLTTCADPVLGELFRTIPTEYRLSDQRERELSLHGFIPLVARKAADDAVFYSANSVQRPKEFGNTEEGKQATLNHLLGTQLPYMLLICRLAHVLKVDQREMIGTWKVSAILQTELNEKMRKFVVNQENPPVEIRRQKPLRAARIKVVEVENDPGWYQATLTICPHLTYMGSNFELSMIARLDREKDR